MEWVKSFCADDDTELSPDEIEMLSLLPDSLEQYLFNLESSQPPTNLDLFELAVNPNINLYDHVLSVDNNPVVQYGGVLNNQLPACTDTDPDCDDTEHPDGDDTSQPSTSNTRPTSGNVDALRETDLINRVD